MLIKFSQKTLLIFLSLTVVTPAYAELLLFSEDNDFYGCLDCGKYEDSAVCNKYGDFGSKYSDKSIWNKYGVGSKYEDQSPFSKYGTGLKVVDRDGNFYGYLSRSYNGNRDLRVMLNELWDLADGDYDILRERFCELDWTQ